MTTETGKILIFNFFEGPVAEYATKKAADRFAKRLTNGGYVKASKISAFDMHWPEGKTAYQVFEGEE